MQVPVGETGKKPSQNELSGENPSGENPPKVSCGENPSPYFRPVELCTSGEPYFLWEG